MRATFTRICISLCCIVQVNNTIEKFEAGVTVKAKAGSGAQPTLGPDELQHIQQFVENNRYSSKEKAAADLANVGPAGESVGARQVRRRLSEAHRFGRPHRKVVL